MERLTRERCIAAVGWGLLGGLAGTIVMDLTLIAAFSLAALPAATCFSIVGDTVARFTAIPGIQLAGGAPLGVAAHYLVGPAIGASFGVAVVKIGAQRLDSMKKSAILGILYVEALSQPLLAAMPLLLKWTLPETLQWYGGALFAHLIAGAVLGLVVCYGLSASKSDTAIRVAPSA